MTALWSNLVDTLAEPVQAFRRMREEPMLLWGVVVAFLSQFGLALRGESEQLPASPAGVFAGILGFVIAYFLIVGAMHYVARALGGRGNLPGAITALGFASLPAVLNAPVYLLTRFLGIDGLAGLGVLAFGLWSLVLDVIALREVYEVSTGKAVGILFLTPLAIIVAGVVLTLVFGVLFAALFA